MDAAAATRSVITFFLSFFLVCVPCGFASWDQIRTDWWLLEATVSCKKNDSTLRVKHPIRGKEVSESNPSTQNFFKGVGAGM